jgi:hypothetical protein
MLFLAMKLMTRVTKTPCAFDPLQHPSCTVTNADSLNRWLDMLAQVHQCTMQEVQVKILSTDQKIASIPPISVFLRPLSDVISSALASNHIQSHDVDLEQQDSDKDTHGNPRVNKFTQGSFYRKAAQACPRG